MPTQLRPAPNTTTFPRYPIQPAGAGLASVYGNLTPQERRDLSDFFSPQSHYETVPSLIADARAVISRPELEAFYFALIELHQVVQPSEWPQVLGAVAEQTVRLLLDDKYPEQVQADDCCIDVYPTSARTPPPLASMGKRSFDAVAWDTVLDCGELHEVKVCIVNFDDAAKLRDMRTFRQALTSHTTGQLWIGLASFLDSLQAAVEKVRTLLGLLDDAAPLDLDFLVPETFGAWQARRFL